MATIKLQGSSGGGSVTLTAPVTATNTTVTFPAQDVNLGQVATFGTTYSTPSRAGSNTAHQNTGTTSKIVMIDAWGSAAVLSMSADGTTWYQVYHWQGGTGAYERASATLIVPPGHYWRFSGSAYNGLVEIS